ncbi:MAG: tyrosine-protein phosphatase [Thermoanaerobaculia bacterium]
MIEVHFHCLPGVDDGPADWEEAVALCRAAAADGATTLIATPHVLRDGWRNEEPLVRDELILKLNTLLGGSPAVLAGCEYFYSSDAVELAEKGSAGPLTRLNRTRYLLVEFGPGQIPKSAARAFHEFSLLGIVPVIAHPERSLVFVRAPEQLESLVARGAVVQVTAGSLVGDFGEGPALACQEFFRRGLLHLISSDAHSLDRRPPRLAAARERAKRLWGSEAEEGLFVENPEALVRSEMLPWTAALRAQA